MTPDAWCLGRRICGAFLNSNRNVRPWAVPTPTVWQNWQMPWTPIAWSSGPWIKSGTGTWVGLDRDRRKTPQAVGPRSRQHLRQGRGTAPGVQALTVSLMQKVDGQDPGAKQVLEASASTSEFALAGSVAIDSVPSGASVWVAGKELGKPPPFSTTWRWATSRLNSVGTATGRFGLRRRSFRESKPE